MSPEEVEPAQTSGKFTLINIYRENIFIVAVVSSDGGFLTQRCRLPCAAGSLLHRWHANVTVRCLVQSPLSSSLSFCTDVLTFSSNTSARPS